MSNTNKYEICAEIETSEHYFFCFDRYVDLFSATRNFHPITAHLLLYGNSQLSSELNIVIVDAVHQNIKTHKAFNQC